jgi:hypothetical protein
VVLLVDRRRSGPVEQNPLLKGNRLRPRAQGSGETGSAFDVHVHTCSKSYDCKFGSLSNPRWVL